MEIVFWSIPSGANNSLIFMDFGSDKVLISGTKSIYSEIQLLWNVFVMSCGINGSLFAIMINYETAEQITTRTS